MMPRHARILSAWQARRLDLKARDRLGIPTLILMENAGKAVSQEVLRALQGKKGKVAIVCGKGNNGGDGMCAARHLLTRGVKPDVYLAGRISEVKGEAKANLGIWLKLKQKIIPVDERNMPRISRRLWRYAVIVDALLGVGLRHDLQGVHLALVEAMNASGALVISVDIPSGLDATLGEARGACVRADTTITFVAKKRGMLSRFGKRHCGRIRVEDIGAPL